MSIARPSSAVAGRRFLYLDAGRGVAALAVMLYHYGDYLGGNSLFKSSFLAVDLFFILSGFVLSHAYGRKISEGLRAFEFMALRLIRLYPVYILATLVGAAFYGAKIVIGSDEAPTMDDLAITLIQNLLFLPHTVKDTVLSGIFPFSPASWSLAAEMFVSVLFILSLWTLSTRALVYSFIASTIVFSFFALRAGTGDLGFNAPTFNSGLLRATFEFSLGMILYRCRDRITPAPIAVPIVLLTVIFGMFVLVPPNWLVGSLMIWVLFPAFILLQPAKEPTGFFEALCEALGKLSYPVYLLHTPILMWAVGSYRTVFDTEPSELGPIFGISVGILAILISWLVSRLYDEPVRRALTKAWYARRQPAKTENPNLSPKSIRL